MRFATGRESRNLLVPHMYPFDLSLPADRIGQAVQTVADNAIYPFDTGCSERFRELISDCLGHS
jgi:hypothetical protein